MSLTDLVPGARVRLEGQVRTVDTVVDDSVVLTVDDNIVTHTIWLPDVLRLGELVSPAP